MLWMDTDTMTAATGTVIVIIGWMTAVFPVAAMVMGMVGMKIAVTLTMVGVVLGMPMLSRVGVGETEERTSISTSPALALSPAEFRRGTPQGERRSDEGTT